MNILMNSDSRKLSSNENNSIKITTKEVFLERMRYLHNVEKKDCFSFLDFLAFELKGIKYTYGHPSVRNIFSALHHDGKIKLVARTSLALYALAETRVEKPITLRYTIGPIDLTYKQKLILKLFKILELDNPAVHDIRLIFSCPGLRSILLSCDNDLVDKVNMDSNKDITLKDITLNDITLKTTVHNTDRVTVMVACSDYPIPLTHIGVILLTGALTRIEDRLQKVVTDYNLRTTQDSTRYPIIDCIIPSCLKWIINMWHFGQDSLPGFSRDLFDIQWIEGIEIFHIYSKKRRTQTDSS